MRQLPHAIACAALLVLSATPVMAQESPGSSPAVPPAQTDPKPHEPIPTDGTMTVPAEPAPGHWQLDFQVGDLRLYTDPESGAHYWYLTYKVVNRTGLDRWWGPKFELLDDSGKVRRSGRDVPVIITKRIEALLGNPLLEDQYQVLGEIRQGEANAKEGFLVWPAGDGDTAELSIFIRGMSSELRKVPDPVTGESKVLYKTVKLDYRVSGDGTQRGSEPVVREQMEWILR